MVIELCFERDGDVFDLDLDLPDEIMTRLLWWIEAHEYALTV